MGGGEWSEKKVWPREAAILTAKMKIKECVGEIERMMGRTAKRVSASYHALLCMLGNFVHPIALEGRS